MAGRLGRLGRLAGWEVLRALTWAVPGCGGRGAAASAETHMRTVSAQGNADRPPGGLAQLGNEGRVLPPPCRGPCLCLLSLPLDELQIN